MKNANQIAGSPNHRGPFPAARPAAPARYPTSAAGAQPPLRAIGDSSLAAGEIRDPDAVAGVMAAAPVRVPAASGPSSRAPSAGASNGAGGQPAAFPPYGAGSVRLDPSEARLPQGVICQRELEDLAALDRKRREIDEERKALRRSVLARFENGCPVQPGRWAVRRKVSNVCRPTFSALEELCGEQFVSDLRERLDVKTYVRLALVESR